jgi:hypothetical protein
MSSSIADLESRVTHARRVHDVAGRVFAEVGEEKLRTGNGRRVTPEAWAYHHAAEALADAEAQLASAHASAEAERRAEAIERRIMQALALGPVPREDLVCSVGSRRGAYEALFKLELSGVVARVRCKDKRVLCCLMPEATQAA